MSKRPASFSFQSGKVRAQLLPVLAFAATATFAMAQIPQPADAPKARTPEESAAAFKLPEGFRMEVVASEPLIASPSAVAWDERGRMFVSELHGYNLAGQLDVEELNKTGKLDTQVRRVQADEKFKKAAERGTFGVVKMLRDTNGDGRMDAVDVWAADLPPAYGLVPARGGVIVACAPDIVFLADRDGDGRAEVRETLFTGFRVGELERGINAPQWGDDGWIYFGRGWGGGMISGPRLPEPARLPDSDFRIRPDGGAIEPITGGTHTFGFAMTEAGDRFTVNTTIPAIHIAPLPWRYLARNPDAATPSLEAATPTRSQTRIPGARSAPTTRPTSNTTTRATARRRARPTAGSPPRAARWFTRTTRCPDCAGNTSSASRRVISFIAPSSWRTARR